MSVHTEVQPSKENGENRATLEKLLRDRQRKFTSFLMKVLSAEDVDAVHDFRVWSRRLQQVIAAGSSKPAAPGARSTIRALRRARRAMGVWRDCDVVLDLINRKMRRLRDGDEKNAYAMIRDLAMHKRQRGIRRARRRIASRKLLTLADRTERLFAERLQADSLPPADTISRSICDAYEQWREALARACERFDPADIHCFRTRTKRLRYRIEMARDLGDLEAENALGFLKSLQDTLGAWHDYQQFLRLTAEALADPEFMLRKAKLVASLLRKSDTQRSARSERIQNLLASTQQSIESSVLEEWIARLRTRVFAPAIASGQTIDRATPQAESPTQSDNPGSSANSASSVADATTDSAPVDDFVRAMNEAAR